MKTWGQNSLTKLEEASKSLGNRSGPNIIWLKEKEDDTKLRVWDYSLKNGIPTLSSALTDWEEGIACLAGKPNSGKSTVLVNMMMGCLKLNDNVLVIDITLDDPYKKRYEQYVASMTGLYYQEITTKIDDMPETKKQSKIEAENVLRQWYTDESLWTLEATEREITEDGLEVTRKFSDPNEIYRIMRFARKSYPDKKIVVFIDAWNNLDFSGSKSTSELGQSNDHLRKLQAEANELGVMVMLSAHLRKGERKSKPVLEDIKGTSDLIFNVVWAGIVINEFREGYLKEPLLYKEGDKNYPAIVIEINKTKVSTVDGDIIYGLDSGRCGLKPLNRIEYENLRTKYIGPRK